MSIRRRRGGYIPQGMHCPKCGYDLTVAVHRQCSECGHVVTEREVEAASGLGADPRTEQWQLLSIVFLAASIILFGLISLARQDLRFVLCSVVAVLATVSVGRVASMRHPPAMRRGAERYWTTTAGWAHFPFVIGPLFAILMGPVRDVFQSVVGLSTLAIDILILAIVGWIIGLLIVLPIERGSAVFANARGARWYQTVLLITAISNGLISMVVVTRWAGL